MTSPLSDLDELLRSMQPELIPGVYAFVSVSNREALGTVDVIATMREPEGLSAVINEADAARLNLVVLFRAAWIMLRVQSDLQAVGLTAAFAAALGQAGIPCNVVAGAWHDHLFVPAERAAEAMTALQRLQHDAGAQGAQMETTMDSITLRPADPARDFAQLAAWFTILEDSLTTEAGLQTEYEQQRERIFQKMAVDAKGRPLGFYWIARNNAAPDQWQCYLFVAPEERRRGVGGRLYDDLLATARTARARALRISVADACPQCRAFAEQRGFAELRHHFGMALDLAAFDDRPWDEIVGRLKGAGFAFTSMAELGNTEHAQRKLYALNDAASASTPGQEGEHPWASFEDFQKRVCQAAWYKPDGQIVAIDTATGVWAAMSAITRFEGSDHAYNLFTGVDARYRGRKLGQAVKIHALRYARNVLKVGHVRTHHNTRNLPMIAIDRKLGYTMLPGTFLLEKTLDP